MTAALALVAALAIGAATAGPASAQLPDICQQYPNLPQCLGGGGGGGFDPGAAGPTGADTGQLPFTGYPISPLLLLALLLLLAGLTLRAYLAIRDRLRERSATLAA